MLLRPRQKVFVERSLAALDTHRNTLGVAPTAAGKTIMLSAVVGALIGDNDAKACVLAQRCAKAAPLHRMFADHKKERQDAPDAELDPANGWCLCGAHHSLKTAQEREKRLLKG